MDLNDGVSNAAIYVDEISDVFGVWNVVSNTIDEQLLEVVDGWVQDADEQESCIDLLSIIIISYLFVHLNSANV